MKADIVIIGGGCAGYSLLCRLLNEETLSTKSIVVIDDVHRPLKQKTWCFWKDKPGYYDHLITKTWSQLHIRRYEELLAPDAAGYTYNMIRSSDFFAYHHDLVKRHANVQIVHAKVTSVNGSKGLVHTSENIISADHIFSSVLFEEPVSRACDINLLQHFKGWFIQTNQPAFNPTEAELMNFSTSQRHGLAFFYVLPISEDTALVEYTLFSEQLLGASAYREAIETFCVTRFGENSWKVLQEEEGIIPMSTRRYPTSKEKLTYIGTAGGQTKASTGYTFQFIQKHSDYIVSQLRKNGPIEPMQTSSRFSFYDAVLLEVLQKQKYPGDTLFMNLFRKNPLPRLFRFLDNESSIPEEFKLMNTTPWKIFLPIAVNRLRCF